MWTPLAGFFLGGPLAVLTHTNNPILPHQKNHPISGPNPVQRGDVKCAATLFIQIEQSSAACLASLRFSSFFHLSGADTPVEPSEHAISDAQESRF